MVIYTGRKGYGHSWATGWDEQWNAFILQLCMPPHGRRQHYLIRRKMLETLRELVNRSLVLDEKVFPFQVEVKTLCRARDQIKILLESNVKTYKVLNNKSF